MNVLWYIIGLFDTILKGFEYGWIFIVPLVLVIIVLFLKRKKYKYASTILAVLIYSLIGILLTSRAWGPQFYKHIIGFYIDNKEDLIEEKLEKKYNKNFTFVSKDSVKLKEKYAGDALGQDINSDYSIKYEFKDDDGVIAIVQYGKYGGYDYYESKRSKYDIEKSIYEYAKKMGVNEEFYVFITLPFEEIIYSGIDKSPKKDFNMEERDLSTVRLIMPKSINNIETIVVNGLKNFFKNNSYPDVYEYVVTEDEYKRAVAYYESKNVKTGIEDGYSNFRFEFDKNKIISEREIELK